MSVDFDLSGILYVRHRQYLFSFVDARDYVVASVSKCSTYRTTVRVGNAGLSLYPNELCLAENDAAGTDLAILVQ